MWYDNPAAADDDNGDDNIHCSWNTKQANVDMTFQHPNKLIFPKPSRELKDKALLMFLQKKKN